MTKKFSERIDIFISKEYTEAYKNLTSRSQENITEKPFSTQKEIFILSAILGASRKINVPLTPANKSPIFHSYTFDESTDLPLLYIIAFQKNKDLEDLKDPEIIINIVEAYANGGFKFLQEILKNDNGAHVLENLYEDVQDTLQSNNLVKDSVD